MSDQNTPYAAAEQETFGFVDDEEPNEESLEDDMLNAGGYREAASYGMTPEEQRRGTPLEQELAAEVPDVGIDPPQPGPGDPIPDEPGPTPGQPDPNDPLPDEPGPPPRP
jgi:hypothetical protein